MQTHNDQNRQTCRIDRDTEESLLAIADGDDTRFAALFVRFAPKLKSYLLRLGVTPASAEDLTQETLLRVWRKVGGFNPNEGDGVGWIYRIARNVRIDAVRRERQPAAGRLLDTEPDPPTPEELCLSSEREERLRTVLLQLPPIQAEMFRRSLLRQGTLAEIATELNLPLSTAKSHLRRAVAQIRRCLEEKAEN